MPLTAEQQTLADALDAAVIELTPAGQQRVISGRVVEAAFKKIDDDSKLPNTRYWLALYRDIMTPGSYNPPDTRDFYSHNMMYKHHISIPVKGGSESYDRYSIRNKIFEDFEVAVAYLGYPMPTEAYPGFKFTTSYEPGRLRDLYLDALSSVIPDYQKMMPSINASGAKDFVSRDGQRIFDQNSDRTIKSYEFAKALNVAGVSLNKIDNGDKVFDPSETEKLLQAVINKEGGKKSPLPPAKQGLSLF